METLLGPEFAPTWAGSPPGMSPADTRLWQNWRVLYAPQYRRLWYNVRLILPVPTPPGTPPEIQRAADLNAAKRIDILADAGDHLDLIELRDSAGLSALGAVLGYKAMWDLNPPLDLPVHLVIVSNKVDAGLRVSLIPLGIRLVIV